MVRTMVFSWVQENWQTSILRMILLSLVTSGMHCKTSTGLQNNGMKVGLRISAEKTKAMIVGEHQAIPLTVDQKDIEYVDKFQYLGSYMSRTGDVDTDIRARIGKASGVFRRLQQHWHEHQVTSLYLSCPTYCHVCRRNLDTYGPE